MSNAIDEIKKMKDTASMFEMACTMNYFAGNLNQKIPVDDDREIYRAMTEKIRLKILREISRHRLTDEQFYSMKEVGLAKDSMLREIHGAIKKMKL